MKIYGSIAALCGSPPLDRRQWTELCKIHPFLVQIPPAVRPNPLKPGESMVVRSLEDRVSVVVAGRELGRMQWAPDDSQSVFVEGNDQAIIPIVEDLALILSATFVSEAIDPEETPA